MDWVRRHDRYEVDVESQRKSENAHELIAQSRPRRWRHGITTRVFDGSELVRDLLLNNWRNGGARMAGADREWECASGRHYLRS